VHNVQVRGVPLSTGGVLCKHRKEGMHLLYTCAVVIAFLNAWCMAVLSGASDASCMMPRCQQENKQVVLGALLLRDWEWYVHSWQYLSSGNQQTDRCA
jgi:hypothetical protein